ncbi:hypothetical protein ACH4E7_45345 [Kitasatospora sp. NPDC018058]|uniref:hypothetical protein n=1 Tax=Kitasatospora sp. NPDC018058 TaxID=3364025 RepID=UPI0037C18716
MRGCQRRQRLPTAGQQCRRHTDLPGSVGRGPGQGAPLGAIRLEADGYLDTGTAEAPEADAHLDTGTLEVAEAAEADAHVDTGTLEATEADAYLDKWASRSLPWVAALD